MNRTAILLLWSIFGFLFPCTRSVSAAEGYTRHVELGLHAIQQKSFDSALVWFWKAAKTGMSRDSLYYFLAELYRVKNVFDTALALNYSIKAAPKSMLKRRTLVQRYVIFNTLQMKNRAEETLDSLWINKSQTVNALVPGFHLKTSLGYGTDFEWHERDYPWHTKECQPQGYTVAGLDHSLGLSAAWRLPIKRSSAFFLNGKGTVRKPYSAEYEKLDGDSIAYTGGFVAGFDGIFDNFQISYEWERKKSYLNSLSSVNCVNILFSQCTDKNLISVSTLYGIDLENGRQINNQYLTILGNIVQSLNRSNQVSVSSSAMVLHMDALTFHDSTYTYQILDFAQALDTTTIPGMVLLKTEPSVVQGVYEHNAKTYLPNSNLTVNSAFAFERSLPLQLSISTRMIWTYAYYLEKYTWSDFKLTETDPMTNKVAFDEKTSQYYWITETSDFKSNITGEIFDHFTRGPIERHCERRVDNTLSATLTLQRRFIRAGVFELQTGVGKTWSTLDEALPTVLHDWNWFAGIQWRTNILWLRKNEEGI
ncbi:MAG: hypothetical protein JW795_01050 [Chitinivibrionales bacterium]|nr:hypothetical protein [Chitinivibrionales bacterium]